MHPADLSPCEVSGSLTDWRPPMEITMADSTNDLYQLQVSPLASSSEGGCFFFPAPVFHRSIGSKLEARQWDEEVPGGSGEARVVL